MKRIEINSGSESPLSAELDLPPGPKPNIYAVFAHCFTCSKQISAARNISRALNTEGIGVLRFDFTGLGNSGGSFEDTNFSANVEDIIVVSDWLGHNYKAPSLLVGHSLGGAAVLFAGGRIDSIRAIATVGAPSSPDHVSHLFSSSLDQLKLDGEAMVDIGGRPFKMKQQFVDDLQAHDANSTVKKLRKPLLIMHSPQDTIVGIENAAALYSAAHHPKSFVSLDGADHLLSRSQDSIYVGQVVANWAHRYLDFQEAENDSNQVVAELGDDRFTTSISVGDHRFLADEPKSVGGMNLGPTPYDLVASGLAACTAMTLKMYANRKKWVIEDIRVHVNHEKKYALDCDSCDSPSSKIDHFDREILIVGVLDVKQRARLLEIADKCPVHKTLEASSKVIT